MDSKLPGGINPSVYTDLNSLNDLKAAAKGKNKEAALKEVAKQFEQIFMNMMLKSMREANQTFAKDDPFNSSEVQMYQGMLDQQMTLQLSRNKGLGLADLIVRQLGGKDATPERIQQALSLPSSGSTSSQPTGNQTTNEALLNMAARQLAQHSLAAVDQIHAQAATQESKKQVPAPVVEPAANLSTSEGVSAADSAGDAQTQRPISFDSPQQFVETLLPMAQKAADKLGVDPRVLVAQAALETGWGKSIASGADGRSSNNLFNIKADRRWQGDSVSVPTLEYRDGLPTPEQARFRAYGSLQQSLDDYVDFIRTNPRYQQALQQVSDPTAYLQALQTAGYATDPQYANKIQQIYSGAMMAAWSAAQSQDG